MIRRPPRSTLFPTRRSSDLWGSDRKRSDEGHNYILCAKENPMLAIIASQLSLKGRRSEEHTSELQSRQYLVCRLLLEKKINKMTTSFVFAQLYNLNTILSLL